MESSQPHTSPPLPASDVVDALYEAVNRRDLDEILALCAEDSAWDLSEASPDQTLYRGHTGLRRYFADEIWPIAEEFRFEDREYHEAGEGTIVALFRLIARGSASGAAVDARFSAIWWVRDGRLAGQKVYPGDDALAAAGLPNR
jgi:ketosteroid isomerase-like protein